ncbi:phenylalanine 4-monooxygenase [Limibacter armeniacum]|uniref:phenylalanine 4-monooxygenase n=1 Tax=Limibacter armeniacum TaxID=466084 RepID=UPI002FE528B2
MRQEYEKYTAEDMEVWNLLFERQQQQLPKQADEAFLEGVRIIGFKKDHIPNFEEMNVVLEKETGWGLEVVKGLIPNKEFFELLKAKRFPASTWFRKLSELEYLEEPDMFHDVYGHVPLLTNKNFAGFLQGLSEIALKHIEDEWIIELISRLYWYTVEFGLINKPEGLRIYGAGILSSSGESTYSLESDIPIRTHFDVQEIMSTPYIKDRFQEKYWVIDSYKELFDSLEQVEDVVNRVLTKDLIIES